MYLRSLLTTAAAMTLVSFGSWAAPAPAGEWAQTSSTAGDCPNCRITITSVTPHIISIAANNDWDGYAVYSDANDDYTGSFEWEAGKGAYYDRVLFSVKFVYEGNTLTMTAKSNKGSFTGTFRQRGP